MSDPQIGDTVIYTDPWRRKNAAIVTNLDGPLRVRLFVLVPNGQMEWVWALRFDPDLHDLDYWRSKPTVGYWEPKESAS